MAQQNEKAEIISKIYFIETLKYTLQQKSFKMLLKYMFII